MRIVILLGFSVMIGGCAKHFSFDDDDDGVKVRLIEATKRAVISVNRPLIGSDGRPVVDEGTNQITNVAVCAEPSPDAMQATAIALQASLSDETLNRLFSFDRSETPEYIGLRTQTIQLLRDAYFRLCEAFLNDGVDAIGYDVLQRRFQSQIVALLAVEQLTGAVTASNAAAGDASASHIAMLIALSEETLLNLEEIKQDADKALADLESKNGESADAAAIESAESRKTLIEEQIERRRQLIDVLKAAFERALQTDLNAERNPGGSDGRSSDANVANAVRAITLNAINQDYESQVCFETLRYHNNSSQFRNDVNNAFDSAGLETNLQERTFLEHCKSLFASQVAFRDARVSVVEAYASAIERITSGVLASNGAIPVKDAAYYIKTLADAVPTEPGTAFLPRALDIGPDGKSASRTESTR